MQSFQLSVRGRPSAFDLHSDLDMCIVAAPGCLTFYNLTALGSPRHVIHYEQPQQVRQVSFQKHGYKVAALRGGVVSLWDASKTLKPLIGIIKSSLSSGNSYITDMRWSNENYNLLAAGTDCGGHIGVWDIRTPQTSIQSMVQSPNTTKGVCQGVEWCPSNGHILASSNGNSVFVWDTRMAPDRESDPFLSRGECVAELQPDRTQGITQFAWTSCDDKDFIVTSSSQGLEWWNVCDSSEQSFERKYAQSCEGIAVILPLPMSNSILTYKHSSSDSVKPTNAESSDSDAPNYLIEIYGASKSSCVDPHEDASSYKVAFCHEPLLGMKWGRAGHLVPPSHSGLELVFLTESASLYAIRISGDVVKSSNGSLGRQISNAELATDSKISPTFPLSLLDYGTPDPEGGDKKSTSSNTTGSNKGELNGPQSANNIWPLVKQDILDLEEFLQIGNMPGLRISLIDHSSRRIILDMLNHDEGAHFVVSLLITIPINFPLEAPSFQLKSTSSSSHITFGSALIAELNAITKRMLFPSKKQNTGKSSTKDFLFEIANCFRNRLLQNWGGKADPVQVMNVSISTVKQKGDIYKFTTDFINPVAYRVPCPRPSAGTFLASGKVLCFGGAIVTLNYSDQEEKNNRTNATSFPKTYADYLIAASEGNENENPLYPDHNNAPAYIDLMNEGPLKDDDDSVGEDASVASDVSDDNQSFASKSNTPALLRVSSFESTFSSLSNKGRSRKDSQVQNFIPMEDSLQSFGENIDLMEFKMKRLQSSVRAATTLSNIKVFDVFDDKSKELALLYSLGPPLHTTTEYSAHFVSCCSSCCRHNATVAEHMGCSTIVIQIWNLLAVSLDLLSHDERHPGANTMNWQESVLGLPLLNRSLIHLMELNDVQVLATVVCILGGSAKAIGILRLGTASPKGSSPSASANMSKITKDYFENTLLSYVSILSRWGALLQATEVLKQTTLPVSVGSDDFNSHEQAEYMPGLELLCSRCGVPAIEYYGKKQAIWCVECDTYAVNCAVCNTGVKSESYFCPSCGHGGHPSHMKEWFQVCPDCPTGCGCRCSELLLRDNGSMLRDHNKVYWESSEEDDSEEDRYSDESDESTDSEYEKLKQMISDDGIDVEDNVYDDIAFVR